MAERLHLGIPISWTTTAGESSLGYDTATDTYHYVWKTDKAWKGTCRKLIVGLDDGPARGGFPL